MSRRQIAPGVWETEPPATPHRSPGSYTVPAENVGHMRPVIKAAYLENRHGSKPKVAFSIHPENRMVPCRITMPITGERCARVAGHADSHRSRTRMDDEARRRRSRGNVAV